MEQDLLESAIQLFPREDGTVSFWDHPNFVSHVALPDNYSPITRAEQGLELIQQGRLNKEQMRVMKVVSDAMCANENQIRRYLVKMQSFSKTSEILNRLRKRGFVQRYTSRLSFIENEGEEIIKPPAPFTLGIAGQKLIKHYYPEAQVKDSEEWIKQPLAVQRYVAVNEARCLLYETGNLRNWLWSPFTGGNAKLPKPMATGEIETPEGLLQLIFERPQTAQNFLGYLKSKLEAYRMMVERDGYIRMHGLSGEALQIVCLYVSSTRMATFIAEEIKLTGYPFDIWILNDEWIKQETGLLNAFGRIEKTGLVKRIKVPFLGPKQQKP